MSKAIPELKELAVAIDNYSYPCVVYDFSKDQEIDLGRMAKVETFIREQLLSADTKRVKDGLSNVLFWGHYRSRGRRDDRVKKFRTGVDSKSLKRTVKVFCFSARLRDF
jgi:hypothetical protein